MRYIILCIFVCLASCTQVDEVELSHPATASLLDGVDASAFEQRDLTPDGMLIVPNVRDLGHSASPRAFISREVLITESGRPLSSLAHAHNQLLSASE